jgi:hypothetical protein
VLLDGLGIVARVPVRQTQHAADRRFGQRLVRDAVEQRRKPEPLDGLAHLVNGQSLRRHGAPERQGVFGGKRRNLGRCRCSDFLVVLQLLQGRPYSCSSTRAYTDVLLLERDAANCQLDAKKMSSISPISGEETP